MEKRKLSYRPRRRARRYLGQSTAAMALPSDQSESEEVEAEAPSSAAKRKLSLGIPAWVGRNSSSDDDSSSSSPHPDYSSDCDSQTGHNNSPGDDPDSENCESNDVNYEARTGYRLVDLMCLQTIISAVYLCKICGSGRLEIEDTGRAGLATVISLSCSNAQCSSVQTYPLVPKSNWYYFDCNRRSVLAARAIGRGHAGLRKFCGLMNLPPPVCKSAFQRHQKALHAAAKSVAETSMQQASSEVRMLNVSKERDEHMATVTFDGTWMKRGFTSLYGVFTCIDWEVGRVLDVHVSAKYCQACKGWMERRDHNQISAAEYQAWKTDHVPQCPINTTHPGHGSGGSCCIVETVRYQEQPTVPCFHRGWGFKGVFSSGSRAAIRARYCSYEGGVRWPRTETCWEQSP